MTTFTVKVSVAAAVKAIAVWGLTDKVALSGAGSSFLHPDSSTAANRNDVKILDFIRIFYWMRVISRYDTTKHNNPLSESLYNRGKPDSEIQPEQREGGG